MAYGLVAVDVYAGQGELSRWSVAAGTLALISFVHGRYRIPWTVPATLLGNWVLLHWILFRRGLLLKGAE